MTLVAQELQPDSNDPGPSAQTIGDYMCWGFFGMLFLAIAVTVAIGYKK
jgi:hypothetical protein